MRWIPRHGTFRVCILEADRSRNPRGVAREQPHLRRSRIHRRRESPPWHRFRSEPNLGTDPNRQLQTQSQGSRPVESSAHPLSCLPETILRESSRWIACRFHHAGWVGLGSREKASSRSVLCHLRWSKPTRPKNEGSDTYGGPLTSMQRRRSS